MRLSDSKREEIYNRLDALASSLDKLKGGISDCQDIVRNPMNITDYDLSVHKSSVERLKSNLNRVHENIVAELNELEDSLNG